jgi:2-polyprenyl-3-methyl-5-hydroxy-6-metoxy-1,4-benzoquinol methylase
MAGEGWSELSGQAHDLWNEIAPFWDDKMGEGNVFQRVLIGPATERLLEVQPGQTVLDIACGNGVSTRRLAALGASVVAFDFSETFIERARARTHLHSERIEYRVLDATEPDQLRALGTGRFDAALCNMAFMDMAAIEPLLGALPALLAPGGHFVFSVVHPCFNSVGSSKVAEEEDRAGELVNRLGVKVTGYITPVAQRGLGIPGQPTPHLYFHRPLSVLLNACFDAGFVLDRLEEPVFTSEGQPDRPFSWSNYREIPPVLVARLRRPETDNARFFAVVRPNVV